MVWRKADLFISINGDMISRQCKMKKQKEIDKQKISKEAASLRKDLEGLYYLWLSCINEYVSFLKILS